MYLYHYYEKTSQPLLRFTYGVMKPSIDIEMEEINYALLLYQTWSDRMEC